MFRMLMIGLCSIMLVACVSKYSAGVTSQLLQGKRDFDNGYYKRTMRELLPLACDGNADAQYAVGYMYYYGYGVAQDTDVGTFWIERSARQHYSPAVCALGMIARENRQACQHTYYPSNKREHCH